MATAPAPAPAPAPPPRNVQFKWDHPRPSATSGTAAASPPTSGRLSPPLIAMVAVIGTAFLIVIYVRLLSRPLRRLLLRRLPPLPPSPDHYHLPFSSTSSNHYYSLSPYGLDDSSIKALPLNLFSPTKQSKHHKRSLSSSSSSAPCDCAVCLVEFERGDPLRTLPLCYHSFHSDCIDTWLRSHANCPLCRAPIFRHTPVAFPPLRSSRIRPSLDDLLLPPPLPPPEPSSSSALDDNPRDFLLTRSYSFGFERTLRPVAEPSFTPWRHHHSHRGLLWSKRWPSPYLVGGSSSSYHRSGRGVFASSSRSYYRRSPLHQQRRRASFLPMSESRAASRRTRSMTSPVGMFPWRGSSREICGDPEALLSPERLDRR